MNLSGKPKVKKIIGMKVSELAASDRPGEATGSEARLSFLDAGKGRETGAQFVKWSHGE